MKQILDIPRTAMEVFNMLPEGTRCEVIDNTLYMSPSPSIDHQDILGDIFYEIKQLIKKNNVGRVFIAPVDVYLSNNTDVVQPDIVYVSRERGNIIESKGIFGAPNFVIEILSTNKSYDTRKKFDLYQRNKISEYVIINPDTKEVLHYILKEESYESLESEKGILNLKVLDIQIRF